MTYRKLDAQGDYVIGTGADFHSNSAAGVAQLVKTTLVLFAGEWYLDTSAGVPWRTGVLGKYTQSGYDALIKDQILSVQGVQSITAYSSSFDTAKRSLSVSVGITTIYGPTTLDTAL